MKACKRLVNSTIDLYCWILYAGAMSRSLRTYYASKNKVARGPKILCTPYQCGCGSDFYFQVRGVDIKTVLISPNASLQYSIIPRHLNTSQPIFPDLVQQAGFPILKKHLSSSLYFVDGYDDFRCPAFTACDSR